MQVTIACHQCDQPKRPLTPCPACHASPLAEPELQAWRLTLHARHLARIKRTPQAAELPARTPLRLAPLRAVLSADELPEVHAAEPELATIVPLEPAVPADQALSFDWEDDSGLFRRSA
ncbi:MAG TPA: hypothetical protein VFH74_13690 [Gaiellales bacterium]|nr:hypothetical protein [Gaiellales bacterium]